MLFWLMFAVATILIAAGVVYEHVRPNRHPDACGIAIISGIVLEICALVMFVCIATARCSSEASLKSKYETYNALIYKAETESIRDEFGVVNKEYIDDIQEWNEDVAFGKTIQDNIWIGIFYPHIYDYLETIDLAAIAMKE